MSGNLTTSATWSGAVDVTAPAIIAAGTTITVAPGTVVQFALDANLKVEGILEVQGEAGMLVAFRPMSGVARWGGISVQSGGAASIAYADISGAATVLTCEAGADSCAIEGSHLHDNVQSGAFRGPGSISKTTLETDGSITFGAGADVTITDSIFTGQTGDLLIMNGGRLAVHYTEVGATSTTEHCGFHVDAADALIVDHSVINQQPYGFMIGGVTGAVLTHNNFVGNETDIQDLGGSIDIDATGNYWSAGAPGLPNFDTGNEAAAAFTDVGPRP